MRLFFRDDLARAICEGSKTQARRIWPGSAQVVPGQVCEVWGRPSSKLYARLKVTRVWKERLGEISDEDARAEGFCSRDDFLVAFVSLNSSLWALNGPCMGPEWCFVARGEPYIEVGPMHILWTEVWVMEFQVIETFRIKKGGQS